MSFIDYFYLLGVLIDCCLVGHIDLIAVMLLMIMSELCNMLCMLDQIYSNLQVKIICNQVGMMNFQSHQKIQLHKLMLTFLIGTHHQL